MKRYLQDFQNISSLTVENTEIGTSNGIIASSATRNTAGYITIKSNQNNDLTSADVENMDMDYIDGTLNYTNYSDLVFIDSSRKIHEIGNSEILFDAMFDYIIRGNKFQNDLFTVDNETPELNNLDIQEDN